MVRDLRSDRVSLTPTNDFVVSGPLERVGIGSTRSLDWEAASIPVIRSEIVEVMDWRLKVLKTDSSFFLIFWWNSGSLGEICVVKVSDSTGMWQFEVCSPIKQ